MAHVNPQLNPRADEFLVVFVGSFNPAIFHPEWFLRQGIITEAQAEEATNVTEVVSPDITRVTLSGLGMEVLQERIVLQTRDSSKLPFLQDTVLAILARLPHTPVQACGLNSSHLYQVGNEKHWHKIGHTLAPKELIWNDLLSKPGLQQMTIKGIKEGEFPGAVNITIQNDPSIRFGLKISSNTHYGVAPGNQLEVEKLRQYLSVEWDEAYKVARHTAALIFDRISCDD